MLTPAMADELDWMWSLPEGEVHENLDGSGSYTVRGRYRSFQVDPAADTCSCGRTGGCAHREHLGAYLAGNSRQCPVCSGRGMTASRADLLAIIQGAAVESFFCRACDGHGTVTVRRRAALEAGLKAKGRAAA
jgi:DnaJ-class molecular chaperone